MDLTRLPVAAKAKEKDGGGDKDKAQMEAVEYSSREVAPPALLLTQLRQAHELFLLHHASSLDELYSRLGREQFCGMLERYWNGFIRDWDVLLHGNPAVNVYNATKLAGGGELGIGVGEEEWGSGEREVLEEFVRRTEGLVDVVVGRFGDEPVELEAKTEKKEKEKGKDAKEKDIEPWLGTGDHPRLSDGIIFSGVGALSRRSLTTVSQWMEAIFSQGENAYGVGENPSSRPRQRRKMRRKQQHHANGEAGRSRATQQQMDSQSRLKSPRGRTEDLRRKATDNSGVPPGIPPPLVGSVERSLNEAVANVQKRDGSQVREGEAHTLSKGTSNKANQKDADTESSYFDTKKMLGYLKLGYGSSWTLNPEGFLNQTTAEVEPSISKDAETPTADEKGRGQEEEVPELQEIDPTPDISDIEDEEEPPFVQRLEQSIGRFLIGLSGDLENAEFEDELPVKTVGGDAGGNTDERKQEGGKQPNTQTRAQRIFLRTLTVQLSKSAQQKLSQSNSSDVEREPDSGTTTSHHSNPSEPSNQESTTPTTRLTKLRVVLYIHQPFIFLFLFSLRTSQLSIPSFYRGIHHQLGPLQRALLRSTDPSRIAERVAEAVGHKFDGSGGSGLYDLIYDPLRNTVRSSIPNIPVPGTLAAEGILTNKRTSGAGSASGSRTVSGAWYTLGIPIGSSSTTSSGLPTPAVSDGSVVRTDWTRVEALNVHTQILSVWANNRGSRMGRNASANGITGEIERTVKTSRGWWVVWMCVPRSLEDSGDRNGGEKRTPTLSRENTDETLRGGVEGENGDEGGAAPGGRGWERDAFLIRKAVDSSTTNRGARGGDARGGEAGCRRSVGVVPLGV